jgi:hypothetical protein
VKVAEDAVWYLSYRIASSGEKKARIRMERGASMEKGERRGADGPVGVEGFVIFKKMHAGAQLGTKEWWEVFSVSSSELLVPNVFHFQGIPRMWVDAQWAA